MQITLFSLLMSVVWSSALAVFNYICRKKHFFVRQIGVTNVLFLYLFSMARMMIPYKFSFTRVIHSKGPVSNFCRSASFHNIGTSRISFWTVLSVLWGMVSAVLILRFICQYLKAVKEFSTYRIREDDQCKKVFQQVINESKKRVKMNIRYSQYINIPMGVGIFRKSIILPDEKYSDSELYYILRHEYTHFLNHDLVLKSLIYIYGCIFWWNPVIYLIKKDLAQIMEIKCDLDVTEQMEKCSRAEYLTTIVTMLKNADENRAEKILYGTAALVSKKYELEILERFKIVSAYEHKRKSILLNGSWFMILVTLVFISYSFVFQPYYETVDVEIMTETELSNLSATYTIKCKGDIYRVYFLGS